MNDFNFDFTPVRPKSEKDSQDEKENAMNKFEKEMKKAIVESAGSQGNHGA